MLDPLLRLGYFPRELPPLFSTYEYAQCVKKNENQLPASFTKEKADWTSATHHNLARVGGLRRRLSAPNPVNFYRVARAFALNSNDLYGKWASPYSFTTPKLSNTGPRALAPTNADRATPRAMTRVGAKYTLRADVSQFYPSIYTHTVSWVIHTKKEAKAKIGDMTLYGNVLDKELQACQSGQTKGVPIGPDTSLGIAELLLADIDRKLKDKCAVLAGVRFIDDMEFSFHRLADAENALACLEGFLNEYELQLNGTKSRIVFLPETLEPIFATQIRSAIPKRKSAAAWTDYFNLAFSLQRTHSGEGVLRFALASLRGIRSDQKRWRLVQHLLWQCIALDPGTVRFVIDLLWVHSHGDDDFQLDDDIAEHALNALVSTSAPVGHGSEVLWSMWAALLFDLQLSDDSRKAVEQMDDSFVAAAACVAAEGGVFDDMPVSSVWADWFREGCFRESHWLFAYEALRQGWMPDQVKLAKLADEPVCKFLREAGVSFIRRQAMAEFKPKGYKPPVPEAGAEY